MILSKLGISSLPSNLKGGVEFYSASKSKKKEVNDEDEVNITEVKTLGLDHIDSGPAQQNGQTFNQI